MASHHRFQFAPVKRTVLVITAVLITLLPAYALAHDLADVYRMALKNDAQLQAAAAARKAQLETKPQARALLLPHIEAQASYGRHRRRILHTDTSGPLTPSRKQIYNEPTANINLTQPIFDWNAWNQLEKADKQVAAAEAKFQLTRQQLITRVSNAYFGVLEAGDNLRFALANKSAISHQLEQAKQRYKVGTAANTDLQNARASFDQAKAEVIQAKSNLRNARQLLSVITGVPTSSLAPLRDEIPLTSPTPDSPKAWVQIAMDSNLSIKQSAIMSHISKQQIDIARSGHFPTLNLVAGYGYDDSTDSYRGAESVNGQIGLQLNIPIFTGGATYSKVDQAQALYQKSLAQLKQEQRQVRASTRNDYDKVVLGVSRVKALRQGVTSAQVSLEATKQGFKVGVRTEVDVLNAQEQLFKAQQNYAQARYSYLENLLQLKLDAGSLNKSDIMAIDQLLVSKNNGRDSQHSESNESD